MRVRRALEEVGQPCDVRPVSFSEMKEPAHRVLHPFGQIPTYEEGDLALFESGVIVFHVVEKHAGLLPDAANGRARAHAWMFAALNTVESPIVEHETARYWMSLSRRLGDGGWLDGAFSAGALMMMVLRRLDGSGILDEYPTSPSMSAAAKRGRLTSVPSTLNWQFSPLHRPADPGRSGSFPSNHFSRDRYVTQPKNRVGR